MTQKILHPRVTHRKYPNGTVKSIAYTIEFSTGIVKYAGVLYRPPSDTDHVKEETNYAMKLVEWNALGGHFKCDKNSICRSVPSMNNDGKVLNCSKPKNNIGNTQSWNRHLHAQEALSRYRQNPVILNFGHVISPVLYFYQYRRLENLIFEKLFHILGVCDSEDIANQKSTIISTFRYQLFNPELTPEEQEDYNRWLMSSRTCTGTYARDLCATTIICTSLCVLIWGTLAGTLFLQAKTS